MMQPFVDMAIKHVMDFTTIFCICIIASATMKKRILNEDQGHVHYQSIENVGLNEDSLKMKWDNFDLKRF